MNALARTPSPFASGWYLLRWSADLAPGQVVPVRYFARDFVLYRTAEGTPVLLDAFCPHLGVRGKVVGTDEENADASIDALAKKYMGVDSYPYRTPTEVRIIYKIEPTSVHSVG